MPIRETLTAKPVSLAEVLSNGKRYSVPKFQRDYAWTESEWDELWADILAVHDAPADANHYLGALVLQPGERGDSRIIDGQQRLVTLSLLALAVIKRIDELSQDNVETDDNRERARLLRERFVSTRDSASLQHHSRLTLNDRDDAFYQLYLVQGRSPGRPKALSGSNQRLFQATTYFAARLAALFPAGTSGHDLARFLEDTVAHRLRFIEIVVDNDETAFTVFETLNARGVALGTADLLKNYVFSVAARGGAADLGLAQQWWEQLVELVPLDQMSKFLFHKLATTVPELREKRVFTEVKRIVPKVQSVFDFLPAIKDAAEIYAALDDPGAALWSEWPEARRHVRVLEWLRVEQVRPVILAALPRFSDRPDRVARLLSNLVVVSLRASLVHLNTGDLQRVYHSTARQIERNELKSPLAIARAMAAVTPDDATFHAAFAQLALDPKGPRKHLVRYLLSELEVSLGGHPVDFDGGVTIEHILPENPGAAWDAFSAEAHVRNYRRLGNLTPLEYQLNKALGNAEYGRKREVYATSTFAMTRDLTVEDWSPETIRARQERMADRAVTIWRIEDLDL